MFTLHIKSSELDQEVHSWSKTYVSKHFANIILFNAVTLIFAC